MTPCYTNDLISRQHNLPRLHLTRAALSGGRRVKSSFGATLDHPSGSEDRLWERHPSRPSSSATFRRGLLWAEILRACFASRYHSIDNQLSSPLCDRVRVTLSGRLGH